MNKIIKTGKTNLSLNYTERHIPCDILSRVDCHALSCVGLFTVYTLYMLHDEHSFV